MSWMWQMVHSDSLENSYQKSSQTRSWILMIYPNQAQIKITEAGFSKSPNNLDLKEWLFLIVDNDRPLLWPLLSATEHFLFFNTDPCLSFSPMEACLDLVTFTLGSLDINPTLSLLCKACEAILLEFKAYKSKVQANLQFVIENKEKIQVYGLLSLISTASAEKDNILADKGGRSEEDINPDVEDIRKENWIHCIVDWPSQEKSIAVTDFINNGAPRRAATWKKWSDRACKLTCRCSSSRTFMIVSDMGTQNDG